jgi:hypothetical protein
LVRDQGVGGSNPLLRSAAKRRWKIGRLENSAVHHTEAPTEKSQNYELTVPEVRCAKRRGGFVGFDVAEVMQADYVVRRGRCINDRFGPDSVLIEAPGHRQASIAIHALVGDCHAAPIRGALKVFPACIA